MAVKYQWNKYSAVKTSGYVESISSELTTISKYDNLLKVAPSYTFNTQDGTFALENQEAIAASQYKKTSNIEKYPYFLYDSKIYLVESFTVVLSWTMKGYQLISTLSEKYSKGDLVGVVASGSAIDYPINGLHSDGYWYEYIGKIRTAGNMKINGTLYDLTGEGYVKINSVLCPLTSSLLKHNATFKPVFVGAPVSRLPTGYTEVEYIESTGAQYIDTGFLPNQNSRVVADAQFVSSANSQFVFGTRTSSSTVNFSFLIASAAFRSDYDSSKINISASSLTERIKVDKNKNLCYINDTLEATNTESTFQCTLPMFLFACNTGGASQYPGSLRIYYCQIYDNGTLIRYYIPCVKSSDVVGMYDIVNDVFYSNAGTGTFTAGPTV